MGARHLIKAGVTVVFCLVAAACSTTGPASRDDEAGGSASAPRRVVLSDDRREFAAALARYSEAIRQEILGNHDAAVSNYVATAALDPSNESLQFRVALTLLRDKRTDEAVALMEGAAKASPKSDRALIWLALVHRSAGHEDKALEIYDRAIALSPTSTVAHIEAAAIEARQGRGEVAIKRLEFAFNAVSTNDQPAIMRVLGEVYLREATGESQKGLRWSKLSHARKRLEAAVRRWPDDQGLLLMLGNLRALDNDIEGAIQAYEEIERRNPDDLAIKDKLAISLMASGNKTGAVAALEFIARKQPTNVRVFTLLAELHEQLGETNKAILNYNLAAKLTPADPLPFLKSSMLNVAAGNPAEAEAVLQKGIAGAPNQLRLREMLGYVLMVQKKFTQSIEVFDAAAEKIGTPEGKTLTQNFLINHAIALQLVGQIPRAADRLVVALRTNSVAVDVYAVYVLQEGATNEIADAATVLALVEEKLPLEPRVPMYLGLILNALERHPEAIEAFARAEKLAGDAREPAKILTASFYFWYASACERTTNITRAAPLFLKSIELNPNNPEARNYLAYMWAEHATRLDDALVHIRKALEAEPDNPAYRDTLAWIYYQRGDTEKALVEIQKAHAKMTDDPVITEHHGDILEKLGRRKDAVEHWKRAYILGNTTKQLPEKLRAAGVDPKTLDEAAAAHRAKQPVEKPKK